jgi:hypothetical protein
VSTLRNVLKRRRASEQDPVHAVHVACCTGSARHIPVPGIDQNVGCRRSGDPGRGPRAACSSLLQLFSGGALTQFAVFALGIMPYITASIIMQILAVVIPKLEQWQEQGAVGQRKITQWTRYLTVGIAVLQGTGITFLFHNGGGGFGRRINTVRQHRPLRRELQHRALRCSSCSRSPPASPCSCGSASSSPSAASATACRS